MPDIAGSLLPTPLSISIPAPRASLTRSTRVVADADPARAARRAAVLVPFCHLRPSMLVLPGDSGGGGSGGPPGDLGGRVSEGGDGDGMLSHTPSLLYTVRTDTVGSHKGQVGERAEPPPIAPPHNIPPNQPTKHLCHPSTPPNRPCRPA